MKYRFLGKTGIQVSALCFGTMTFGSEADKNESKAMFDLCRETGINFFDCANKYSDGRAEQILGECIQTCRHDVVITTKATSQVGPGVNELGSSPKHLMIEMEKSLNRLQTDYIDIYFIHYFDAATSIENTFRFLETAIRQGKILHIGVSNWAAWQIMKCLSISQRHRIPSIDCIQPMYSLIKRQAEVEILPMAQDQQLGVISYSPLGAGVLTGKYSTMKSSEPARLFEKDYYYKRYQDKHFFETADQFVKLADLLGYAPVPLAICWAMTHPAVTAPIIGARNMDQLKMSLKAIDINMTPDLRQQVSSVSPSPPPAHDRLEEGFDPKYTLR